MKNDIHPNLVRQIARILKQVRDQGLLSERWLEKELLDAIIVRRSAHPKEDDGLSKGKGFWSKLFFKSKTDAHYAKACADILRAEGDISAQDIEDRIAPVLDSRTAILAIVRYLDLNGLGALALPFDRLDEDRFESLVNAGVYRFAYGRFGEVEFEQKLVFGQTSGVYELFLKASGSGLLERRLLAIAVDEEIAGIRAVELYRKGDELRLRSGLIAPRIGVHCVLLSDEGHPRKARDLVLSMIKDEGSREQIVSLLEDASQRPTDQSWLEMHHLGFYNLRSDSADRMSGAFLDGERFGAVIGRRTDAIKPELLDALSPLGRAEDADLTKADRILIEEMPKLSTAELAQGLVLSRS